MMNMMGDKIKSKKIAKEVDVPTIPGVEKAIKDMKKLKKLLKKLDIL